MTTSIPHPWLYPSSLEAAAALQRELAQQVSTRDEVGTVHRIAGVDVSNAIHDPEQIIYATVVNLEYPSLTVIESARASAKASLPYVPGFLAFRETPPLVKAYEQLAQKPDLLMADGHGISHPRGLGIASHLGVLLDVPSIGVAKSILVGKPAGELGPEPGDCVPLVWQGREIAMVLRTKRRANPVYVSVGHKISLPTAVDWVFQCLCGYRLPEPTRLAHLSANAFRKEVSTFHPL